jgi:putative membrane protein
MQYLWFKALHVAAVLAWISVLASLLALCAAQATGSKTPAGDMQALQDREEVASGSNEEARWKVNLQRSLFFAAATPAMLLVLLLGFGLGAMGHWFAAGWLHVKLILVCALIVLHVALGRWATAADLGRAPPAARAVRWATTLAVAVPVGIILLVVLKPI